MSAATLSKASSSQFLSTVRQLFVSWLNAPKTDKSRSQIRFEQAEKVRAKAYDLHSSDPAFAQDLYAAADRHEFGEQA